MVFWGVQQFLKKCIGQQNLSKINYMSKNLKNQDHFQKRLIGKIYIFFVNEGRAEPQNSGGTPEQRRNPTKRGKSQSKDHSLQGLEWRALSTLKF